MVEEKHSRTLDALLVSPASTTHVTLSKGACGLFYTLVGATIAFAINSVVVVHWGLAVVTAVVGGIFSVSLGLLLGTVLESRQQMMLWAWVVMGPLLLSMMVTLLAELMPPVVVSVFRWVPTTLMLNLTRTACAGTITLSDWLPYLVALVASGAAAIVAVVGSVRRSTDR